MSEEYERECTVYVDGINSELEVAAFWYNNRWQLDYVVSNLEIVPEHLFVKKDGKFISLFDLIEDKLNDGRLPNLKY